MNSVWVLKHSASVVLSPVTHSWTDIVKSIFSILGLSLLCFMAKYCFHIA